MGEEILCWKCGSALVDLILPMSRREECAACGADQHVCRLCSNYDSQISNQCKEDRALDVADKERANFCDYFEPKSGAFKEENLDLQRDARAKLAELFGEPAAGDDEPMQSCAESAQAEWEKLFGSNKD